MQAELKPCSRHSSSTIVQCIVDTGLHAAPVGAPVIMICCSIAACSWLLPAGIQELQLVPCTLKIAGETEMVAFDKTGTLTGSLMSMPARLGVEWEQHCNYFISFSILQSGVWSQL